MVRVGAAAVEGTSRLKVLAMRSKMFAGIAYPDAKFPSDGAHLELAEKFFASLRASLNHSCQISCQKQPTRKQPMGKQGDAKAAADKAAADKAAADKAAADKAGNILVL